MRVTLAIAMTTMMALSAPAFAQSTGSPGAVGAGSTGSGSNTPGGGMSNGQVNRDTAAPSTEMNSPNRMNEGRATAPDDTNTGTAPNRTPEKSRSNGS